MPKGDFIGITCGLECDGHGMVGKMVRVELFRQSENTILCQAHNGRNGAPMPGRHIISTNVLDQAPSENVDRARYFLNMCGWSLMSES